MPREVVIATKATEGGMVEIRVAASGPGLAADVKKRLFQPLVTTKDASRAAPELMQISAPGRDLGQ